MWFHRVTLLVLIYVVLDFANPMMPGAVHLVEGSLETVAGCQARSAQDPAPVVTAIPRSLSMVVPRREAIVSTGRIVPASQPVPLLFPSRLDPGGTPASSSDDD